MNYSAKLKDPRWQRKRLEILQRDDFRCKYCHSSEKQLHVHHNYYVYGIEIWDYPDDCYDTLCYDCHYNISEMGKEIKDVIKKARYRRFAEIRNILIMLEHMDEKDLIEARDYIADYLRAKGFEIE